MRRREFIAASTAAAVVGTGCIGPFADDNGDGSDTTGDESGPEAAMRGYVEARDSGDVEAVNSFVHDDGRLQKIPEGEELNVDSVEVEEMEVLNQTEDMATVRVVVRVRPRNPGAGERTEETRWELHTSDGEWKIWNRLDGSE